MAETSTSAPATTTDDFSAPLMEAAALMGANATSNANATATTTTSSSRPIPSAAAAIAAAAAAAHAAAQAKAAAEGTQGTNASKWSKNGFGAPVRKQSGKFSRTESELVRKSVEEYCRMKQIPTSRLCSECDHKAELKGAWMEISKRLPHRSVQSVYRHGIRQLHPFKRGAWSEEECMVLAELVQKVGKKWSAIQAKLNRSADSCRDKYREMSDEFVKGRWKEHDIEMLKRVVREQINVQPEMDMKELGKMVEEQGIQIPWSIVSKRMGNRSRLSCYKKFQKLTDVVSTTDAANAAAGVATGGGVGVGMKRGGGGGHEDDFTPHQAHQQFQQQQALQHHAYQPAAMMPTTRQQQQQQQQMYQNQQQQQFQQQQQQFNPHHFQQQHHHAPPQNKRTTRSGGGGMVSGASGMGGMGGVGGMGIGGVSMGGGSMAMGGMGGGGMGMGAMGGGGMPMAGMGGGGMPMGGMGMGGMGDYHPHSSAAHAAAATLTAAATAGEYFAAAKLAEETVEAVKLPDNLK